MTSVEAGTKLACFTLSEVGKYDIGVGGPPQVCIIRPNQKVEDKSDNLRDEMRWVAEKSEQIRKIITGVSHE
jgi:20S proteasome alpha/beta subunit